MCVMWVELLRCATKMFIMKWLQVKSSSSTNATFSNVHILILKWENLKNPMLSANYVMINELKKFRQIRI
jgi:hypothetical protein